MSLRISSQQLIKTAEVRFLERLAGLLPADPSDLRTDHDTLMEQLADQCERAQAYGLSAELDVARYVITAWLLGQNFDARFPAMQEVLMSAALSPAQKSEALERITQTVIQGLMQGSRRDTA